MQSLATTRTIAQLSPRYVSPPAVPLRARHAVIANSMSEKDELASIVPQKISSANRWIPPVSRFAPSCARELSKSALVRRSDTPVVLPYADQQLDIQAVSSSPGGKSLAELLAAGTHDGMLILHHGKIVAEHTTADFDARLTNHAMNSSAKVAVACIAGALVGEGKLDLHVPLETYVPEAKGTGYEGVTVQQALDMQSGVELDPYDEFFALGEHPKQGDREAIGVYRLALSREQRADAPRPRQYQSVCTDTDMVGIACERVTGKPYKTLLSDLWQKIGAAENADLIVDDYRTPVYNGGLVPTLHDLGRFGMMLANGGRVGDTQVVPKAFIEDSLTLTPALKDAYQTTFYGNAWPSVAYHNTFFIDAERPGTTVNYGAFGNLLMVDHNRQMVGVLMSAWAAPNQGVMDWIGAFNRVSDTLAKEI